MSNNAGIMSLSVLAEQRQARSLWYITVCISSSLFWLFDTLLPFFVSSWLFLVSSRHMLSVLFSNSGLFIAETCSAVFTVTQMIVGCHAEVIGAHLNLVLKFSDLFQGETERWMSHCHLESNYFQFLVTLSDRQTWIMPQDTCIHNQPRLKM